MEVQLIGPLAVLDGERRIDVGARKERAVFAALALRAGHVVSVGELIDALWGSDPPATAVKTLQGYVSKMRRVLGPGIVVTERPGYVLRLPPDGTDIVRVHALVDGARRALADGDTGAAIEGYRDALRRWRGSPLPDLASSEIGRREIARLDELRYGVVEELIDARLLLGEHHLVLPDLEALVREAPLRERAWGLLLLALYRSGRQADALRAYQSVRTLLVQQIGVEPGASLRDLEARIIAQDPTLHLATVEPPASPRARPTHPAAPGSARSPATPTPAPRPGLSWVQPSAFPFAGRDAELAQLGQRWAETIATDHRHAVLVGGEPGIGKTRLIGEAAMRVHDEGGLVLFGRCEEGLAAPYQPFVEALGSFVRACPGARLAELVGPLGGELTRLLPELRTRLPDLAPPIGEHGEHGDTERHRLFEAISELLERLGTEQPVLLVVDDLQWATTPTLLLLRHVVTGTRPARLLIAGTYRTTALDRLHPLADTLADLRRHESIHRLVLDGLDESAALTLASIAAEHELAEIDRTLIRRLHRECNGNPFFFWALLTNLVDTGLIVRRDGRWTHSAAVFDTPLPQGIREVVARRLSSLDDATNALLRVAALVGSGFDYRVVGAVADVADDIVLDALDQAREAGVVVEQTDGYGQFAFTHDLMRRSLEEELSTTRRARLHWRIADALTERYGERLDEHLDEVARHAIEGALAGDPDRASAIARRAGDASLDALAFEAAAAYYDDALGFVADDDHARRYELLLARGRAFQRAGNPAYVDIVREAVGLARRLGDAARLAAAVIELRHSAYLSLTGVNDPELRANLVEALDGLDPAALGVRARLTSMLALTLSLSEERERSLVLSADAVALARASEDPKVLAQVLADHTWVITGPDTVDERIALGNEAVALAHRLDDHLGLINAYNCLTNAYIELGDLDRGERALRRGLELADFLRRPMARWGFRVHEAALLSLRGDVPSLEATADELLTSGTDLGVESSTLMAVWSRLLFAARYEQGRLAEFEEPILDLADDQPVVGWQAVLGALYAETGRLDEAREIVRGLRATPPQRDLTWVAAMMLTTTVVAEIDDPAPAAWLYDELRPFAGRNTSDGAGSSGPIDLGLGRLATVMGRWDDAATHFVTSRTLCDRWRAPMWIARTSYEHAVLLTRQPSPDHLGARRLFDESIAIATTTGQTHLAEKATSLLATLTP